MSDSVTAPPPPCPAPRARAFTREVWVERLARFPDSGLTVAQFCAIEAVSLPSFYAWRRRLAAEGRADATPPEAGAERGARLLPVRLSPPATAVELVLPTGVLLRLSPGCDPAWVRSLVAALGGPSC
jgi:transposase